MNNEPVELSFFSDAIIRRWYLPVGFALVAGLIGLQLRPQLGPTLYEAEAKVLIRPVTDSVFDSKIRVDQVINPDTEAQLASSELVARNTLELLGEEAPNNLGVDDVAEGLEINVRTDSQIVVIRYQHIDPDIAGAISDAVAEAYLASRSQTASDEKVRQANQLATQISDLTRELTTANITIATADTESSARESLVSRIQRLEEVVAIQALEGTESEIIGDPIGTLTSRLDAIETTIEPTELAAAQTTVELVRGQISNLRDELIKLLTLEIDGGAVIQNAGVGTEVLPANQMIQPALGALVGLMVGIAAAVTVERAVRSRAASHRPPTAPTQTEPHAPAPSPQPTPDPRWTPAQPSSPLQPAQALKPTQPLEPANASGSASPPAEIQQDRTHGPVAEAPHLSNGHTTVLERGSFNGSRSVETSDGQSPTASNRYTEAPVGLPTSNAGSALPLPDPATWGRRPEEPAFLPAEKAERLPAESAPSPKSPGPDVMPTAPNTVAAIADIAKIPRSAREPVVVTAPDSDPATGLRTVAQVIQNETADLSTPSIMITSAKAHEGRTTVATNVAAALRQDGLNVLLITDSYDRVIAPDVHILPPGMHLGPDLAFPETARLRQLLDEARSLLDIVIIDGPPTLIDGEAKRLAALVDATVMVAVSGRTSAADVAATKNWLEEAGTRVLGLVTTTRPSWLVRRIGDRSVNNGTAEAPPDSQTSD